MPLNICKLKGKQIFPYCNDYNNECFAIVVLLHFKERVQCQFFFGTVFKVKYFVLVVAKGAGNRLMVVITLGRPFNCKKHCALIVSKREGE
jgi:hypothetical protein